MAPTLSALLVSNFQFLCCSRESIFMFIYSVRLHAGLRRAVYSAYWSLLQFSRKDLRALVPSYLCVCVSISECVCVYVCASLRLYQVRKNWDGRRNKEEIAGRELYILCSVLNEVKKEQKREWNSFQSTRDSQGILLTLHSTKRKWPSSHGHRYTCFTSPFSLWGEKGVRKNRDNGLGLTLLYFGEGFILFCFLCFE